MVSNDGYSRSGLVLVGEDKENNTLLESLDKVTQQIQSQTSSPSS